MDRGVLRLDTLRVRTRLAREKALRRNAGLNIKHGAGGMLDVYFGVRYLQLRDNVPDDEADRTTLGMLGRLRESRSIDEESFSALSKGYTELRSVDHQMRLIVGRSAMLPAAGHPAVADIARRLGYATADALLSELQSRMNEIRNAYNRIMESDSE
jgi:glutamine synthetase adenylyltransferase